MKLIITQRVALDRTVPIAVRRELRRPRERTAPRVAILRLLSRAFA